MDTLVQYDETFIYAPSFALWERGELDLSEGKAVGTAREQDLVFLDKDRTMDSFLRPEEFARERKVGVTVGKRKLKRVQDRVYKEMWPHIASHDSGETWNTDFRREATTIMKRAWKDVFDAGVRSTGIRGEGRRIEFTADDQKWLKGAMSHEMRFLNGFVNAITDQTYVMPLDRRLRMYVDALESFYDSARVMGMPATSLFRWTGRNDKKVCESCKYLKQHNPYHKKTLPTTPRSGLTLCLTNCRDRLLVRLVSSDEALRVLHAGPARETHIRKLRQIKRKRSGRGRLREDYYYARESLDDSVTCGCGKRGTFLGE
jgi:hypothetical protein